MTPERRADYEALIQILGTERIPPTPPDEKCILVSIAEMQEYLALLDERALRRKEEDDARAFFGFEPAAEYFLFGRAPEPLIGPVQQVERPLAALERSDETP